MEATTEQYAATLTRCIAAYTRTGTFEFPLASSTKRALDDLLASLEDDAEATTENSRVSLLHAFLVSLFHRSYQKGPNPRFADPVKCFVALEAIDSSGSWKDPKHLTQPIRHLTYMMQITAAVRVTLDVASGLFPTVRLAMEALSPYHREFEDTPYSNLYSLQHLCSSFAYSAISMPTIWWTVPGEELMIHGRLISIAQIKEVVAWSDAEAIRLWKKVCFGLEVRVDYTQIFDDLSSKAKGDSFLTNAKNPFADHKNAIFDAVMADKAAKDRWTCIDKLTKRRRFTFQALNHLTESLGSLEVLSECRVHIICGAPPRGSEGRAAVVKNTSFTLRNMYAFLTFVGLVLRYHKGSFRGHDKLIPHGLDAFTGDLMVQYHALARPLVCMIIKDLDIPDAPSLIHAYSTYAFMGNRRPITGVVFQRMFQRMFERVGPRWAVTPSLWRHISVAIGKALCRQIEDVQGDLDDEQEHRARQTGHSLATEKRIYAVEHSALGDTDEATLRALLDVSSDTARTFGAVPGGLDFPRPFHKATSAHYDSLLAEGAFVASRPAQKTALAATVAKLEQTLTAIESSQAEITYKQTMILTDQSNFVDQLTRSKSSISSLFFFHPHTDASQSSTCWTTCSPATESELRLPAHLHAGPSSPVFFSQPQLPAPEAKVSSEPCLSARSPIPIFSEGRFLAPVARARCLHPRNYFLALGPAVCSPPNSSIQDPGEDEDEEMEDPIDGPSPPSPLHPSFLIPRQKIPEPPPRRSSLQRTASPLSLALTIRSHRRPQGPASVK